MIFALLIFLFAPFVSSAPLSDADTERLWKRSLDAYNRQDYKASHTLLYTLVKARPKNALYWFNLGNAFFMLKSYNRAEICFLKVETLKSPLAPAARLYRSKAMVLRGDRAGAETLLTSLMKIKMPPALHDEAARDLLALQSNADEALTQYKKGQYKRALRIINQIEMPDRNLRVLKAMALIRLDREDEAFEILKALQSNETREMRGLIDNLLDRLRDTYSRKYWLYVEAASGWDSNFQKGPSPDSAIPLVTDFGGGARWWTRDLWYANTGYYGHLYDVASHPAERVVSHEVRVNVGREIATDLILFTPFVNHETYGGTAARMATGLALKLRGGEDHFEYGLDAEWSSDRDLSSEYEYLAGASQRYRLYFGSVRNPIYARGFLTFEKKDIGDQSFTNGDVIPSAYRGVGPGARVLWKIQRAWVTELNANYFIRTYPTQALPGQELREDQELSLSFRITNLLTKSLSLYASAGYTKNSSTLGTNSVTNPNYSQSQILLGALWDAN